MKLSDITFWVSPLTHSLLMGTVSKRKPNEATDSRDITGLMINGVIEVMRKKEHESVEVTQDGKRYRLSLVEVDAALSGISPTQPGWISVEERLPEDDCPVLVATYKMLGGGQYITKAWFHKGTETFDERGATHWMSLPAAPIASQEDVNTGNGGKQPDKQEGIAIHQANKGEE